MEIIKFKLLSRDISCDRKFIRIPTKKQSAETKDYIQISQLNNDNNEIKKLRATHSTVCKIPHKNKLSLVIDLDETLIHTVATFNVDEATKHISSDEFLFLYPDRQRNGLMSYINGCRYYVIYKRPHMIDFIKSMYEIYNIYVYTNGTYSYAERILNMIKVIIGFDPFIECYSRKDGDECTVKYLNEINCIDVNKCVIVDDISAMWPNSLENVIQIKQYIGPNDDNIYDDTSDEELYKIESALFQIYDNGKSKISIIDDIKSESKKYCADA
jgi:TFIIF-interacting CTD phosphatase-like protein